MQLKYSTLKCTKIQKLGNFYNSYYSKFVFNSNHLFCSYGLNIKYCSQCLPGSLSPHKAKGKIVLCLRGDGTRVGKGQEAKRAGAAGFILGNIPQNGRELIVDAHVLPATAVSSVNTIKILKYINSTKSPMAYINPARTVLHSKPAPYMTSFSGRGPNVISPSILKVTNKIIFTW